MAQVLRSYKEYIARTRKALYDDRKYLGQIALEHKAVLEAIKVRDVEGAKEAMGRHLDESKKRAEFVYNIK